MDKQRLRQIMMGNFSQKIMLNLGVLCKPAKSDEFFTASDVADSIVQTSGITGTTKEEFAYLVNRVSSVLTIRLQAKHQELYRTTKRISPRFARARWPDNCNISFGYRLGVPVQAPAVNGDTIKEAREACAAPIVSTDFKTLIAGSPTHELADMAFTILVEMNQRLMAEQEKNLTIRKKLDIIKQAHASAIEDL